MVMGNFTALNTNVSVNYSNKVSMISNATGTIRTINGSCRIVIQPNTTLTANSNILQINGTIADANSPAKIKVGFEGTTHRYFNIIPNSSNNL
jgi:hypothetical protein